jgi:hypothetical protein
MLIRELTPGEHQVWAATFGAYLAAMDYDTSAMDEYEARLSADRAVELYRILVNAQR